MALLMASVWALVTAPVLYGAVLELYDSLYRCDRRGNRTVKIGVLFQPGGVWIGIHYSPFCKRYCINIIPCVTIWVMLPGGKEPHTTR